jgi:hypothetical protein
VFDNLIQAAEMPVTIGVFVAPGKMRATRPDALDRFNRSFEYDSPGDTYVRFLLEELLPEVEKQQTAEGRAFRTRGNDRAIGGSSSRTIAASPRPGSAPGAHPGLQRHRHLRRAAGRGSLPDPGAEGEPKPIRRLLAGRQQRQQPLRRRLVDGQQTMERALAFGGYEVLHVWGDGGPPRTGRWWARVTGSPRARPPTPAARSSSTTFPYGLTFRRSLEVDAAGRSEKVV